ncbi:MAG: NAD(P)-dependent oxidoreductase [Chloroflexi bacterium]|nr:MAG: NAD(P)-dependent oxidoreductase [Chloroflexota bacterium]
MTDASNEKQALSFFITGALTGAGRALTRYLVKRGHQVTGVVPSSLEAAELYRSDGGLPCYCDPDDAGCFRSMMAMAKADVVVHLGVTDYNAPPSVTPKQYEAGSLTRQAEAVMEAAGKVGAKRVIYASFAFLYGSTGKMSAAEAAPLTHEHLAFVHDALHAEQAILDGGVPGYVLRTGYLYGATDPLQTLRQKLLNGSAVPGGDKVAPWLHVDDLAQAVALIGERQLEDEGVDTVYNLAATHITPSEFVERFAQVAGFAAPRFASGPLATWRQSELQRWLLTLETRITSDKIEEELGWKPRYEDVAEGLDQALLIWRAEEDVDTSNAPKEAEAAQ